MLSFFQQQDRDYEVFLKEENLKRLENLIKKIDIESIEDYKEAYDFKKFLSSLFCYAFNSNSDKYKQIGAIEAQLGQKIARFVKKRFRIKDKVVKAAAKYAVTCWRCYYSTEDKEKIIKCLLENKLLYKKPYKTRNGQIEYDFLVTGLHYAVGDNTFSIGKDGKEYRNYVSVCVPQAFYLNDRFHNFLVSKIKSDPQFLDNIPLLPEYYTPTLVEPNLKDAARIYLNREEKDIIWEHFCHH